jgi:hypothetical protein
MTWIPVEERLPEDDNVVLAWSLTDDNAVIAGYDAEDEEEQWSADDPYCTPIEVSHWMPLPDRPVS